MESNFHFKTKVEARKAQAMLLNATGENWVITGARGNWWVIKMKSVNNLMSGRAIEIAADTPLCCDPSSETYWSM